MFSMKEGIGCRGIGYLVRNEAANAISAARKRFEEKIDIPGLVSDENVLSFLEDLEEAVRGKNKERVRNGRN